MTRHRVEVVGAAGHAIGTVIGILGVVWNWRRDWLFFGLGVVGAVGHGYATYVHVRDAGRTRE